MAASVTQTGLGSPLPGRLFQDSQGLGGMLAPNTPELADTTAAQECDLPGKSARKSFPLSVTENDVSCGLVIYGLFMVRLVPSVSNLLSLL